MTTGALWQSLFQGDEDNIRKVPYGSWLIRDWNFATTSLTGFTPFNTSDGNLISTLFSSTNPGGPWNDTGYMDEKGPKFTPKLEVKPTKVMQSRWPARYDYTGQSETISANLLEANPVVDALYNNAPLWNFSTGTTALQEIGAPGYNISAPVNVDLKWRQCMFIAVDGRSGINYYWIRIYPKVLIADFGETAWNLDDPAGVPMKAFAIPDEYTIPPDGVNVGSPRWTLRDGPGWRAQGQSNFEIGFPTVPVATPVTGLKVNISFTTPAGLIAPVTYTATKTTGSTTTALTLSGSPTVSGNTTTVQGTSLSASTAYTVSVVATDSATPTATVITSASSGSFTSTSS
jgi:hypothetical protein